jgi:ATP-dependent Zn protease
MNQPDTEELTAYHEAGHALMAVACGGKIVHVSITPPDDDGLKRFGESIVQWPRSAAAEVEMAELKVSLAGPVAELTFDGARVSIDQCAEFADDWRRACMSASRLKSDAASRQRLLTDAESWVWNFFEDENYWAATCAIADELLAHETIEHDAVADAWDFWKRR